MAQARWFPKALIALLITAAVLLGAGAAFMNNNARAQAAPAGWSLCNQTSYIVEVATGRPDGRAVLVSGWLRPASRRVQACR